MRADPCRDPANFGVTLLQTRADADLLGHSSISITGDIYGHTSDETARSAVDGWSGVLGLSPPLRYIPGGGIDL